MRTYTNYKQKGFTLIELLVVIAIVSVLAAILFPVFARARENARRASCMSNLKQLGLAMMMYVQDYDERFPGVYFQYTTTSPTTPWNQFLQPYAKSTQVFQCPSAGKEAKLAGATYYGYYGVNADFMPRQTSPTAKTYILSSLNSPSTVYMIMDAGNNEMLHNDGVYKSGKFQSDAYKFVPGMGAYGGDCSSSEVHTYYGYDDCMNGRHFQGVNVTFADGHVKWLKSSVVMQAAKNWSTSPGWNPAN